MQDIRQTKEQREKYKALTAGGENIMNSMVAYSQQYSNDQASQELKAFQNEISNSGATLGVGGGPSSSSIKNPIKDSNPMSSLYK